MPDVTLLLAALLAAAPDTTEAPPSSRIVRRLEQIVVRAQPLHDPLSSQSVHVVSRAALRELPVDDLAAALALRAGVVAQGDALHVRGGRYGDTPWLLRGVALSDALRGRSMELPLLGVETVEIVSGGLDPEWGGGVAGIVQVRTLEPRSRPEAEARWETDAGTDLEGASTVTAYDRVSARVSGPVLGRLGVVAAADLRADDTHLPALRSRSGTLDWRADNRLLGLLKLAAVDGGSPLTLEVLGSRRVDRPFDLMWSLDGWTNTCNGPFCSEGPGFRPLDGGPPPPGYERYRAADHALMTDDRRLAVVLSGTRALGAGRLRGALGWVAMDRLTSVGGTRDESYALDSARTVLFGYPESPAGDPMYAYRGDAPFFQRARAETWTARADWDRVTAAGNRAGAGAGFTWERARLRELDGTTPASLGLDRIRDYDASAPGGFLYAQGRWIREGLVLNGGLRLEAFTAGAAAREQTLAASGRTHWSLSPRLGVAYPVSVRDVLSLAYVRVQQNPGRDYLYDNRRFFQHRQPSGNPALEPVTLISYQAALKHLFDGGRALQAAVFYRDLFGQIGARDAEGFSGTGWPRYENADKGHADGFELSLLLPANAGLSLEAQYTFLHAVGTQSLEEGVPYGARLTARTESLGDYPLDWDRRHSLALNLTLRHEARPPSSPPRGPVELLLRGLRGAFTLTTSTQVGSGMPWTPSPRRSEINDPSIVNSARFGWTERTHLAARWRPLLLGGRVTLGADVRNLFDFRADRAATVNGYPHPEINTTYDDYGAHRRETGLPGGAYWDSDDETLPDAWVRVHDPRLFEAPRLVRFSVATAW